MRKNNRSTLHIIHFIIISILFILWSSVSNEISASDYEAISTFSVNNSKPQIKVDNDNNVHIVWQGVVDGKAHILYREIRNDRWEETIIIDNETCGKNKNPFIIIDNNSNIHIFWSGLIDSNFRIFHSYRINGYWYKDKNPIDNLTEQDNEFPYAIVDENNTIHLVWFSGNGINDRIYYGICRDKIHFETYGPFDDNPNSYNWFPQLFNIERLWLTYFSSIKSNFIVKAVEIDKEKVLIKSYFNPDLDTFITNRLPQLLTKDGKQLIALWYDTYNNHDRIFLLMDEKVSIIDENPDEDNILPFGILDNNNLHIVWCSTHLNESKILYKSINADLSSNKEIVIDDENKYFASPHIDVDNTGTAYIVWYSSFPDGGDGFIYYKKLADIKPILTHSTLNIMPFIISYNPIMNAVHISLINDKSLAYNIQKRRVEDLFGFGDEIITDFSGSEFVDFGVSPKQNYIYRIEVFDNTSSQKILLDILSLQIYTE